MRRHDSDRGVDRIRRVLREELFHKLHDNMHRRLREAGRRIIVKMKRVKPRVESHIHKARREELLKRPDRFLTTIIRFPERLIFHRYCHTSKATYVNASKVLLEGLQNKVRGIYVAISERVDRLRRPMARLLTRFKDAMIRLVKLIKKLVFDKLTRIIKIAKEWVSANIGGHIVSPVEAAIRQLTIAKWISNLTGRREDYITGKTRHCSVYVIVEGIRMESKRRSGWYYWHNRWVLCQNTCSNYNKYERGVCQSVCNVILGELEPNQLWEIRDRWQDYLNNALFFL